MLLSSSLHRPTFDILGFNVYPVPRPRPCPWPLVLEFNNVNPCAHVVANLVAKRVPKLPETRESLGKYQDFPLPKSNFPCPKSDFLQRFSNFCQRLSAFLNGFLLSSTAFQFSSMAFHFPRNPRKFIYGGKYPKDCYSSFVFPATCSPSFVIPATMSTSPPTKC